MSNIKTDTANYDVISKKEERDLIRDNPENFRQLLIEHNIKLAFHFKEKYKNIADKDDLFGQACLGLAEAADRFDPVKYDVKFSDYAYFWIKKYVLAFIRDKYREEHISDTGENKRTVIHLESPMGTGSDGSSETEVGEVLDIPSGYVSPSAEIETGELTTILEGVLDSGLFSEREQKILKKRFLNPNPITLREISETMGCSITNVKIIEKKALEKFRAHISEKFGIKDPRELIA